jgi:predicted TIM-barrel fold metal-dependent hydrolase
MIIDSLTHLTPDGAWFSTRHDASFDRLRRELDQSGIDRAVVVGLAGYITNDFILESCARDSRLIAGCSFDPTATRNPAKEFRHELQGGPFRVLKLHPRLNRYDPLDERCIEVLEELASWDRPMLVWIDSLFGGRGVTMRKATTESAATLADRFPALQFVFLHAGGPLALTFAEALRDRSNVTLDLSFTLMRYAGSSLDADLRWLLGHLDRRLIFGSDFPEYAIGEAFDALRTLGEGLPDEKLRNVAGDNLSRLLAI